MCTKFSWKTSFLVTSERERFRRNYLKNYKPFINFLFHFWNLHQIFKILKKKVRLVAQLSPKLLTLKDLVTLISETLLFRIPVKTQRVNGSQTLLKYAEQLFCLIASFLSGILREQTSLLVASEILGLFVNTLIADDKYCCNKRKKNSQAIQIQLFKRLSFRTPFNTQRVNGYELLLKYARQHCCPMAPFFGWNLSRKTSLLVPSEILDCLLAH